MAPPSAAKINSPAPRPQHALLCTVMPAKDAPSCSLHLLACDGPNRRTRKRELSVHRLLDVRSLGGKPVPVIEQPGRGKNMKVGHAPLLGSCATFALPITICLQWWLPLSLHNWVRCGSEPPLISEMTEVNCIPYQKRLGRNTRGQDLCRMQRQTGGWWYLYPEHITRAPAGT